MSSGKVRQLSWHRHSLHLRLLQILGGDSAVNGLVWITGAEEEYDAYEALGSPGWNWHNMHQCLVKVSRKQVTINSKFQLHIFRPKNSTCLQTLW